MLKSITILQLLPEHKTLEKKTYTHRRETQNKRGEKSRYDTNEKPTKKNFSSIYNQGIFHKLFSLLGVVNAFHLHNKYKLWGFFIKI
mgnify:CR=1 FL=1